MKNGNDRIIAVKGDSVIPDEAFAELMHRTESSMNDAARCDKRFFARMSASELEEYATYMIGQSCSGTPFNPNHIRLVSGQSFPDITAESCFGVEVKSTNKNHWTSTGSSIVESTRDRNVRSIYMLFGKLGGDPAEFKCRPYDKVLYDITVTHSPRYLINMQLKDGESIFSKMHVSYDDFRTSKESIAQVRKYYKEKAERENKQEMPWWLADDEDHPQGIMLRMWKTLPKEERDMIRAEAFVLFPRQVLCSDFDLPALWMCTTKSVINTHFRDVFSAGGRIKSVNGILLANPLPKIIKSLIDSAALIRKAIADSDFQQFIAEYNGELLNAASPIDVWIGQVKETLMLKKWVFPFESWFYNPPRFEK